MKKLMVKDKQNRSNTKQYEKRRFLLRILSRNNNFSLVTRWKAMSTVEKLPIKSSSSRISNRCILTINRKRLNTLSKFSRTVFLKLIRSGVISGIRKASW
jgi:ribosomal protein S14